MNRTTVVLPKSLKVQAVKRARARGISFGELLREALTDNLRQPHAVDREKQKRRDAINEMLKFSQHAQPGPKDLAENLDDYLYGQKAESAEP